MNPVVHFELPYIEESIKKINHCGGEVLGEPMEIPGFGVYV